jgi:hypothetical protein
MGLRPGLKVLEKKKKSLAFVPGFELLDHPAHCPVCIVIILFVIHIISYSLFVILNILYSLSMNREYYVSHYYRAGGYVLLTWIILFKKMWLASCTVLLCQRYNANT